MKRKAGWWAVTLAFGMVSGTGSVWSVGGNGPGGGSGSGGGNKPPVESSNNLSFPAVLTAGTVTLPGAPGLWALAGTFPTSVSYGCAVPETVGSFSYPNTSCVDALGTPLSLAACQAICGSVPVERIYWQKQAANVWQAQNVQGAGTTVATHVDWGDNLESVTWTASSVIRVEATPFTTLPGALAEQAEPAGVPGLVAALAPVLREGRAPEVRRRALVPRLDPGARGPHRQ